MTPEQIEAERANFERVMRPEFGSIKNPEFNQIGNDGNYHITMLSALFLAGLWPLKRIGLSSYCVNLGLNVKLFCF